MYPAYSGQSLLALLLVQARIARELNCLALNNNVPIVVAAVTLHDHGISANLRACGL
jgi:hypothetical protein